MERFNTSFLCFLCSCSLRIDANLQGFMFLFSRFSACYLTSYIFRHMTCLFLPWQPWLITYAAKCMLIKAISTLKAIPHSDSSGEVIYLCKRSVYRPCLKNIPTAFWAAVSLLSLEPCRTADIPPWLTFPRLYITRGGHCTRIRFHT